MALKAVVFGLAKEFSARRDQGPLSERKPRCRVQTSLHARLVLPSSLDGLQFGIPLAVGSIVAVNPEAVLVQVVGLTVLSVQGSPLSQAIRRYQLAIDRIDFCDTPGPSSRRLCTLIRFWRRIIGRFGLFLVLA